MTTWADVALRRARDAALLLFLGLLCAIAATVLRGLRANHVNQLGYTLENLNRGVTELNLASRDLRLTSATVSKNSQAELDNSAAAIKAAQSAAAAFGTLVAHTDAILNTPCPPVQISVPKPTPVSPAGPAIMLGNSELIIPCGLLPGMAAAIAAQSASLGDVERRAGASINVLNAQIGALAPVIQNTARLTANAADLTGNAVDAEKQVAPDLEKLIHEAAGAAANTDATTGVLLATSKDVQAWVHRETAPERWFVTLGKDVAGLGIGAYGVLK